MISQRGLGVRGFGFRTKYSYNIFEWDDKLRVECASRRGGLEVEGLLHKLHDSTLLGSNPARRQKDFRSNSNTTGGALNNNVQKLTRLSSLD